MQAHGAIYPRPDVVSCSEIALRAHLLRVARGDGDELARLARLSTFSMLFTKDK